MQTELQSRMIFLDTNTYETKNFQFEAYELAKLKQFITSDHAYLLVTDTTVREVKKHLSAKAIEPVSAIKAVQKEAMILRNVPDLPWHGIFERVTPKDITERLLSQFDRYISGPNVEIVPVANADIATVFDAYFSGTPPFDGPGKKSEFPDAFVLDVINKISKNRGHKLYVVSNDGDFKRYCALHENLISISTVSELIDLIVRNSEELREPAKFADGIFETLREQINTKILEALQEAEFSDDDTSDMEFEIAGVEIETCDLLDKKIVEVSRDFVVYAVDVIVKIVIVYDITDYERSPWDPEDKAYMFLLTNRLMKRYTTTRQIHVSIDYDDGIKENAVLAKIDIEELLDLSDAKAEIVSFREMDLSDDDV
jgi:hypothetical protein